MLEHRALEHEVISETEVREIMARLHPEDTGASAKDVAEALGVPEERVRQVLADIRLRRQETTVRPERRRIRRYAAMAFLFVLAVGIKFVATPHATAVFPNFEGDRSQLPPVSIESTGAPGR